MKLIIFFVIVAATWVVSYFWQRSDKQNQKRILREMESEEYMYEMEPFFPKLWYWDTIQEFPDIKRRKVLEYDKNKKILAVYDHHLVQKRGWRVYIVNEEGKIQKCYMRSKDLTPKRV